MQVQICIFFNFYHIQEYVQSLSHAALVTVCTDLFQRCPGAYSDYILLGVEDEATPSQPGPESPPPQPESPPHSPPQPESPPPPQSPQPHQSPPQPESPPPSPQPNEARSMPPWCRCGRCRRMPREIEHKCCRPARGHDCITQSDHFARLCLDPMVLDIAMRIHEDMVADIADRSNANYRHQAYRTWTYWQHGRLGPGNRRVAPSCVVWAIRDVFYEPTGIYKGYIEGAGFMND